MSLTSTSSPVITSIGESLFDVFEDRIVLGGAPLNFAIHAQALLAPVGRSASVASRVGLDELGQRLLAEVESRGVSTKWIQIDPQHPTGRVIVTFAESGEPQYEIAPDAAWDFMQIDERLLELARSARFVCFSTLAQRSPASRRTIRAFLAAAPGLRLFDINLRQQFYSRELIEEGFSAATHAKLNEDETRVAADLFSLGADDPIQIGHRLIERFDLKLVAITRGARGTTLVTADRQVSGDSAKYDRREDADTVGAGDACNAGLAVGLLLDWELERVVALANDCGAFVASQPGATPHIGDDLLRRHKLA